MKILTDFIIGGILISTINYIISKQGTQIGAMVYSLPSMFIIIIIIDHIRNNNNSISFNNNVLKYMLSSISFYISLLIFQKYKMHIYISLFLSTLIWFIFAITIYKIKV